MEDNNLFNLMHQLTQEQKSLWRIKGAYTEDAEGSSEVEEFWKELATSKEQQIESLKELIKKNI